MKHKKKLISFFVLSGLMIFLLFPRTIILSSARELKIADLNGNPIKNAIVRQVWYQYSLRVNHEEDFLSDMGGNVFLPERKIKTRNFDLFKGCISNIKKYFIHASCCTSDSIGIFSEGYEGVWFHDGKGLKDGLVTMTLCKSQLF